MSVPVSEGSKEGAAGIVKEDELRPVELIHLPPWFQPGADEDESRTNLAWICSRPVLV